MSSGRKRRRHWFILIIPYVWSVFLIPLVNQVQFRPFGMPFLELWMLLGVILVSVCIAIVYKIDNKM